METQMLDEKLLPKKNAEKAALAPVTKWNEILILIHGITSLLDPERPEISYERLVGPINEELAKNDKPTFKVNNIIPVSWGTGLNSTVAAPFDSAQVDGYLAEVERRIAQKVMPVLEQYDREDPKHIPSGLIRFTLRKAKIRETLLYGIPDLFYYISSDGEQVIRNRLFQIISETVRRLHQESPEPGVSLTIIGHSAGSVIAHDFLYQLFGKTNEQIGRDKRNAVKKRAAAEISKLREIRDAGQLRLRRLYTIGSPITALKIRSNSLIQRIMNNEQIDPGMLGLTKDETLPGPRWVNFWDIDDYASFPVEPIYQNEKGLVRDEYLDHDRNWKSDFFPNAHGMYWESRYVAQTIASNF
jgi:hypothetical protein